MAPGGTEARPSRSFWLEAPSGPLFATLHAPPGRPRAAFLEAPALAPEHLHAIPVMHRLAAALAEQGIATLQVHPRGMGESPGEEPEMTADGCLADLEAGRAWLRKEYPESPAGLLALRLGAALGARLAETGAPWDAACLIAPVLDLRACVQQLLRAHLAAQMVQFGKVVCSRAELAEAMRRGDPIELEGHEISGAFLSALEGWQLGEALRRLGPVLLIPAGGRGPSGGRGGSPSPAELELLRAAVPADRLTAVEPLSEIFWVENAECAQTRCERLEQEAAPWIDSLAPRAAS